MQFPSTMHYYGYSASIFLGTVLWEKIRVFIPEGKCFLVHRTVLWESCTEKVDSITGGAY